MALQMLQERITAARYTKFEGQEISRDRIDHLNIDGIWSSKLPWLILSGVGTGPGNSSTLIYINWYVWCVGM